ncbi:MAG: N-acetylmuramoyl-L-alanine amidase [Bacteroidales bacterium]|nr:N-acetylmuramoyl-L-alanine amidase [Bacteroidales bacterium]
MLRADGTRRPIIFAFGEILGSADWADGALIQRLADADPDQEADFYLLRHTSCPAVLTENLFMDNHADCAFLLSPEGQQALVDLHVDGIISHLDFL